MMLYKLALGLAPAILLIGTQAIAAPPPWKVSEVSGDVRLSDSGRTRAAGKGALLGSGAIITTAPGARAVIVRGQEFVVISPGTRIRVPEADSPNAIMQLIEDWGSALFKIEKKSTPHFGVQTPYLAAVVKGTTFTVTVGPENAKVKVTEGAVQVSTLDGGASDLVRPGSLAMVGKSDLYRLTVEGEGAKELRSGAAPVAIGATAAPAPNAAAAAKGDNRSPRAEAIRIARTIGERPMSLATRTDGLIEGSSAAEHAQAAFNENSRNARGPKPDKGGGADQPETDGKPAKEAKPGKQEKPAKDEKPGKDRVKDGRDAGGKDAGKSDEKGDPGADKGDKGDKGDKVRSDVDSEDEHRGGKGADRDKGVKDDADRDGRGKGSDKGSKDD